MSLGGLIGSVMKPAAEAGAKYAEKRIDLDIKKELMDAEEQKLLRIDEIKRQRDLRDIPLKGRAETDVNVDRTERVGEVETNVMVNRENAMRDPKAQTAEETTKAQGRGERANLSAYADDPNARKGARAKASDSESSGTKAQGALAQFKLTQEKALADLRTKLSKLPGDSAERTEIERQIKDLSGSLITKSYSDMVTAAESYRKMAANLRKDAEDMFEEPGSTEKQELLRRARIYEEEADAILQAAKNKRLSGSTSPKTDKPSKGTNGPKEGDTDTSKSGKPIIFRNGQWEYK